MLSRPLSNERVELPATGSPAVPKLPLAQSSALEPESQRLSSHRFIIAHKAACLKAEALIHRGAAPSRLTPGHTDPTHSHIREADQCSLKEICIWMCVHKKKIDLESIKAKGFTLVQMAEKLRCSKCEGWCKKLF